MGKASLNKSNTPSNTGLYITLDLIQHWTLYTTGSVNRTTTGGSHRCRVYSRHQHVADCDDKTVSVCTCYLHATTGRIVKTRLCKYMVLPECYNRTQQYMCTLLTKVKFNSRVQTVGACHTPDLCHGGGTRSSYLITLYGNVKKHIC